MEEKIQNVENSGKNVDEMVASIVSDKLNLVDAYIQQVETLFMGDKEALESDLNKIILQIPIYMYNLIVFAQQIEMRKGVAKEHASFAENEQLLTATGTVNEKKAKAENATAQHRIVQLAYTSASALVQKKLDILSTLLDSSKKVQQAKLKEKFVTSSAGSSAATF